MEIAVLNVYTWRVKLVLKNEGSNPFSPGKEKKRYNFFQSTAGNETQNKTKGISQIFCLIESHNSSVT